MIYTTQMVRFDVYLCKSESETGKEIVMLTFQHTLYSVIQKISVYISQIAEFMSILKTCQLMSIRANVLFTARIERNVYCNTPRGTIQSFVPLQYVIHLVDGGLRTFNPNTEILGPK